MPQFLFDTDHLTLFQYKHLPLMQRIAAQAPDSITICPINIEETMRGRLAVLARQLSGPKHVQAYATSSRPRRCSVGSRSLHLIAPVKLAISNCELCV